MFSIKSIDHIVLRTDKLEQMLHFYCQVLGCKIERETEPSLGLTQLRAGNALIDIVEIDSELGRKGGAAPTKKGNNLDHFCLQLESISEQDIKAHFQRHGIEVGNFEKRYGAQGYGQSLYIKDPQGNTVEVRSEI
ncbi:VOC family protein [Thalassotalea sp. G2M2-11]|uniref:VOC family protein n=1 Tax=Thalassotalea sp. G2M2-11 TaxID=2787627 RepID=UPI0019D31D4F|nr:VOC family protein [Thalassotalea sp. G2M2-11]